MKIELNIKKIGTLTGSCGWVSEKLQNAEIEIKNKSLYVTYLNGKDKDGNTKLTTKRICGVIDSLQDWSAFAKTNGVFWKAFAYDENFGCGYDVYTLFDTILTSAAKEIADEFIERCTNKFVEIWENDK